jgi:membrane-associated phospholipid phosphatase
METRTSPTSRKSFFSGHTSQTAAASFFFAKVITDYHPTLKPGLKAGLWIFAASIPAINGYLRVQAGKHFPTDVITGYIVGAATGWLIPQLHRTPTSKAAKTNLGIGFIPTNTGMILNLTCRF